MKLSKEFKIGVVVTAAIALFVWGFNFLKGVDLFNHKYELYATYPRIDGLIEGTPLVINGFKVGQVNKIALVKQGNEYKVAVKFILTEDVQIPQNSVAKVVSSDLLGSKAVEVVYSNSTSFIQNGDTLLGDSEEGLKSAVDKRLAPLQKKAEGLISSIDSVMTVVMYVLNDKTRENLTKSFESITKAIQSLEQTAYKMDELMASEQQKISSILSKLNTLAGVLEKNSGKIDNTIGNLSTLSDSLAKSQLKSTIANTNKTLKELNELLTQVNAGKGSLGKFVKNDSLYVNLNKASEDLDKLLQDLRMNPKRYVNFSVFGGKDRNKPKL